MVVTMSATVRFHLDQAVPVKELAPCTILVNPLEYVTAERF